MKIYVARVFLSEVMPPEVTCSCPFRENHFIPPVLQEDHTGLVVWGDATTCHEAGQGDRQG